MNRTLPIAILVGLSILSTLTGCAKFPAGPTVTGKQLVLTLKVRGRINIADPNYHYFIAIDNDGNPNTGPWAAVLPPYGGNGWVTSQNADLSIGLTSFIQYDATNTEAYIYGILPGSFFLNVSPPQPPIRAELLENGSTLRVVVDLSQVATAAFPVDDIEQLDINFITTNALPLNGEFVPGRIWDGLGPSGQNYVDVDTTNDRLYYGFNADGPAVSDPDLDISYWSIEVQTVSSK